MRHPHMPRRCSWNEELCAGAHDDKLAQLEEFTRVHQNDPHLPQPTVSLQLPLLLVEV
jgi:hypothetical protein